MMAILNKEGRKGRGKPYPYILISGILLMVVTIFLFSSPPVHADGGAPNLAYVVGTAKGISTIDIGQQKVTGTMAVGGDPHTIYLSLDGRFLYVAQPALGRITMLAAKTGQTICAANVPGQPTLLAFDTTANVLYAAGNGASSVSAIDPSNCAIKHTFMTGGAVYGLAVANIGSGSVSSQIWVSGPSALNIFDPTGKLLGSIPVPGGPQYLTIPPGTMAYVTTRQGGVDAIDLSSHQVLSLITGGLFGPMDYDAITGDVYVPDQQNKRLDVLTPLASGETTLPPEPSRKFDLNAPPQSVAITSDGQLGFVALKNGSVAMIDIPGRQIVNTIFVGGSPHFIITGLYPPLVGTTPQQASIWGTVINIAAYVLVVALFIVPILLFRRYSRTAPSDKGKMDDKRRN
jgi:DNA-binding beta-propeller fold protein YncE